MPMEYLLQERVDFSNYFTLEKNLAVALSHSPSLRYISMYDCTINCDLSECIRSSSLTVLATNPHLKAVLCRGEAPKAIQDKYPGRVADLLVHDSGELYLNSQYALLIN